MQPIPPLKGKIKVYLSNNKMTNSFDLNVLSMRYGFGKTLI